METDKTLLQLFREIDEEAQELKHFGDSKEKARGYAIEETLEKIKSYFETNQINIIEL